MIDIHQSTKILRILEQSKWVRCWNDFSICINQSVCIWLCDKIVWRAKCTTEQIYWRRNVWKRREESWKKNVLPKIHVLPTWALIELSFTVDLSAALPSNLNFMWNFTKFPKRTYKNQWVRVQMPNFIVCAALYILNQNCNTRYTNLINHEKNPTQLSKNTN